ncbi:MAG: TolC family protein [Thermodesulfobacteriota bacterium]
MLKKIMVIYLLLSVMGGPALGGEEERVLSLKEAVEMALERSAVIHSAREGMKGADYLRKATMADFFPTLRTEYDYTRLDEDPFIRLEPLRTKRTVGTQDNYSWTTVVDQPLFRGGALYWSYRLAKLGVDLTKVSLELVKQDLILQVKAAYFTILKAEKIRQVAVQAVQQLESQLKVSRAFYEVGIIPKNDLLQTQVQMAQARQNLTSAEVELAIGKASFNTLLRRDVGMEVKVEDILEYRPMEVPFEESLEKARKNRPELKETELTVKKAEKEVQLARSEYFPTVNLIFDYERVGDDPGVSGSEFEDKDSWNIMASARWTFWQWGKKRQLVREKETRLIQAKDARVQVEDSISLEVKDAYLRLREARDKIGVAEVAIEQAEENFRMNQERFKEQVATSTDVLDAQTLLTQARTNYFNALSDYRIAWARLDRAMGIVTY